LDALPDLRLPGEVHSIVPTVDRAKGTVLAKVYFLEKDPRILPDMSARVSFLSKALAPEERVPVTAVPLSALATRGEQQIAFLVQGEKVVQVPILDRRDLAQWRIVTQGLQAGDQVVLHPAEGLEDGSRIRPAKR
jgi:multidrug efflux pump subunit AcrA (membrane-fusion protein)